MTIASKDMVRIISAVIEDLRDHHRQRLIYEGNDSQSGHTALVEYGDDVPCLTCGRINEADYLLAEIIGYLAVRDAANAV